MGSKHQTLYSIYTVDAGSLHGLPSLSRIQLMTKLTKDRVVGDINLYCDPGWCSIQALLCSALAQLVLTWL